MDDESADTSYYNIETETFTLKHPTKEHHDFSGWTGTNGTTPETTVTITIGSVGDRAYTANWELKKYTVTFDGNGAEDGVPASISDKVYDDRIKLPAMTTERDGYSFGGWNTVSSSDIPSYIVGADYVITGDVTLYAIWLLSSSNFLTDTRDGQTYRTVEIGGKTWMAQNLNFRNVEAGDTDSTSWCYDDDPANCETYGRLYNWDAAMEACPAGWHLSSDADWIDLIETVGEDAGMKLKATSGWDNDGNGTDEYGFSALPGGGRFSGGQFNSRNKEGSWWTDLPHGNNAYRRIMQSTGDHKDEVNEYSTHTGFAFSVRCVMGD